MKMLDEGMIHVHCGTDQDDVQFHPATRTGALFKTEWIAYF